MSVTIPRNDDLEKLPLTEDVGCPACGGKTHVAAVRCSYWGFANAVRRDGTLRKQIRKINALGRLKEFRVCEDCFGWTTHRIGSHVTNKGKKLWEKRGRYLSGGSPT
jgi:hypothetical protein